MIKISFVQICFQIISMLIHTQRLVSKLRRDDVDGNEELQEEQLYHVTQTFRPNSRVSLKLDTHL